MLQNTFILKQVQILYFLVLVIKKLLKLANLIKNCIKSNVIDLLIPEKVRK